MPVLGGGAPGVRPGTGGEVAVLGGEALGGGAPAGVRAALTVTSRCMPPDAQWPGTVHTNCTQAVQTGGPGSHRFQFSGGPEGT